MAINNENDNDVTTFRYDVISNFFGGALFLVSSLVIGPSFMSISLLFLDLWQFSFIKEWLEIWKSVITLCEFFRNIRRLGQVRDTKFGKNVSNVTECCKSCKSCWVVKGKNPTDGAGGEWLKITPSLPPRLGLRRNLKKDRKWVDVSQKKPPEVLCNKNCSEKFRKLPYKIRVLESLFNKGPATF